MGNSVRELLQHAAVWAPFNVREATLPPAVGKSASPRSLDRTLGAFNWRMLDGAADVRFFPFRSVADLATPSPVPRTRSTSCRIPRPGGVSLEHPAGAGAQGHGCWSSRDIRPVHDAQLNSK